MSEYVRVCRHFLPLTGQVRLRRHRRRRELFPEFMATNGRCNRRRANKRAERGREGGGSISNGRGAKKLLIKPPINTAHISSADILERRDQPEVKIVHESQLFSMLDRIDSINCKISLTKNHCCVLLSASLLWLFPMRSMALSGVQLGQKVGCVLTLTDGSYS